jgi:hypothetical protein
MTIEDIRDLLSLMPRAVDLVWRRGSGPVQCDEAGETLPMPLLHFALPLDDMEAVRAFLREHGKHIACYRLDPRKEGKLMVGMFNDGEAKAIAREELNMEVPEGLFGQSA